MIDGQLRRSVSAEELDYISNGEAGVSVISTTPLRQFTLVNDIGPVDGDGGVIGVVRASGDVDKENPLFGWHLVGRPIISGPILHQMLLELAGLYAIRHVYPGAWVARESGNAKYKGLVTPRTNRLTFEVDIFGSNTERNVTTLISRGKVFADGKVSVMVERMIIAVSHHT